jgi:hypothetical protein
MSVTKRISTGDYNLTTLAASANTVITTHTLKINGNLMVTGNSTVINANNLSTADPTITLNANASVIYPGVSGLEIYRPTSSNPGIFWNENTSSWQFASNIGNTLTYANIGASAGSGIAFHMAYYATSGTVLSDAGVNLIWNGTNLLTVTGNISTTGLQLPNIAGTPAALAGNITLSGNTTGSSTGGTGIYFNNNTESGELISKSKALAYNIIFG